MTWRCKSPFVCGGIDPVLVAPRVVGAMHSHGKHEHAHSHGHHSDTVAEWRRVMRGQGGLVAKVALLGLVANAVLCLMKFAAGFLLHSTVLLADASHALSDTTGDIITILCLVQAQKRPTKQYPYGYGKLETVGSVGLSVMLLAGSTGIAVHTLSKIFQLIPVSRMSTLNRYGPIAGLIGWITKKRHHHNHVHTHDVMEPSALVFVVLSIVVKEALYRFTYAMARKTRSAVLEASAYHHHMEAVSSLGSFLAMAGTWLGFPVLDPLGGFVLALLYGWEACHLLVRALQQLCDKSVGEDTKKTLRVALDEAVTDCGLHPTYAACTWRDLVAVSSGPLIRAQITLQAPSKSLLATLAPTEAAVRAYVQRRVPSVSQLHVTWHAEDM